ncbi:PrsW family intramembrane metalloprotease [Candidatus Kaiserbacteria bacterium]|nr:PrsW family intramembrane metalloprotease [Candidatus Kaiserbacteria bacterium]
MLNELLHVLAAAAGGILPALAWLWFWLREDSKHPEPRQLIALAFLAGMATVAIVIPIENYIGTFVTNQTLLFTFWSAVEEISKYLAALAAVLWRREDDEPVDVVIYMIIVALGFAAAENSLFLLSPLAGETIAQTIITGNLRFIGATLLHVLSSAVIGVVLALSFYSTRIDKFYHAVTGVILAILLHSLFNFFILNAPEESVLRTFGFVWLGVIALLAVIEFIKRIRRDSLRGSPR